MRQVDPSFFHTPPGWTEEPVHGGRRPKVRWVQRDAGGALLRSFDRRVELEEALEAEHAYRGGAWLGQFVAGVWEIRPRAVASALQHVLEGLVACGAVSAVSPQKSARPHTIYCAANRYFAGEPFPRASGRKEEEAEEEEPEQLADIELERQRNIARNQAILRQLGLA